MHEVCLAGETLGLLPERALWWPARRWLLVADLHLGRQAAQRAGYVPAPEGPLGELLARLGRAIDRTEPAAVVVLGDLVHAAAGLAEPVVEEVARWRVRRDLPILLVPGNHERQVRELPPSWRIEATDPELRAGPFRLAHVPTETGEQYGLHGHLHPTFDLRAGFDHLRLPCFHLGPARAVLPAFDLPTAGVRMRRRSGVRVYIVAERRVLPV